jgi:hypothetical protein
MARAGGERTLTKERKQERDQEEKREKPDTRSAKKSSPLSGASLV